MLLWRPWSPSLSGQEGSERDGQYIPTTQESRNKQVYLIDSTRSGLNLTLWYVKCAVQDLASLWAVRGPSCSDSKGLRYLRLVIL